VAFKGMNDAYYAGVEYEKISDQGPLQKKIIRKINLRNLLCKFGLLHYKKFVSIIFKEEPSIELAQALISAGYAIVQLPENPYISD
jgi:hypothetical protein